MKVTHPNAHALTPEEQQELEKLRLVIQRSVADGKLSQQEIDAINAVTRADGKITYDELRLYRELILDRIRSGELVYEW